MGNYISRLRGQRDKGTKRNHEDLSGSECDASLNTPQRKRMKCTSRYIYDTLFVNGENYDIQIVALGKTWKLHKVYLCQSGYFSSMFNGSWRETDMDMININIPDQNIDKNALDIAFGSLYKDDVFIAPASVVKIMAAASLLQLDGLILQCSSVMSENIGCRTVCSYYSSSSNYGQDHVTKQCFSWLETNLMSRQSIELLTDIGIQLMEQLICSPRLFVMQVEMDVYTMLKKWLFIQIAGGSDSTQRTLLHDSDNFFKHQDLCGNSSFLHTSAGRPYACVFRGLRLYHIINDLTSNKLLSDDVILPEEWLLPVYRVQWNYYLELEQGNNQGPLASTDPKLFDEWCMRCGRILPRNGEYCWRWTGYNYGLDLLVSFHNKLLAFKRNTNNRTCVGSVSMRAKRSIVFRVAVASLDGNGSPKFFKESCVRMEEFSRDQEIAIMNVGADVTFPLHVSANFLYFSPQGAPPVPPALDRPGTENLTASESSSDSSFQDFDDANAGKASSCTHSVYAVLEAVKPDLLA